MKMSGENVLHAPVERVWDALLDPAVLVVAIPGCSRLEATGEHGYDMTVTAGVAAIQGTYAGTCRLHDLQEHRSLRMDLQGAGASGTIGADVAVSFADAGDGTTRVTYDADAVVGGMVGGVGQRMLASVSRRMAAEFFAGVDAVLTGAAPAAAPQVAPVGLPVRAGTAPGQVFTAPAPPASPQADFLRGVAVGAGLVLAGVLAGAVAARRR
ncbi:SRPBCC family protein [Nocardioides sp. Soil805]|uniref:SRPBCC family protein n=1 Tax=Nocardioides sp. Soil805 TaxID=1736416 RepID=UPI000702F3B1|nr:carbon monoxide dehydrogenase subunit G [Nocardioides sp. Soil805]KRF36325.1 carbon monoxide dehydrogenase [Nocardioides sp. Soil805]